MSLVAGLLNQTISSIYSTTKNGYGDVTRTELYTDVPCRWQEKVNRVINPKGEIVESRIDVWLLPSYTVNEDYEVVKSSFYNKFPVETCYYSINRLRCCFFLGPVFVPFLLFF